MRSRTLDVELYAGAGGTSTGAARAGARPIGLEVDEDACRSAVAAGHPRIRTDVAAYPTAPFARCRLLLASPPCQPWSYSGRRLGEADRVRVHRLVDRYAAGAGEDVWRQYAWEDVRSHHAAQPVRWIHDLRPEAVFLEQVPPVLPLWRHIGRILTGWGYHVWTGRLCAADYGTPQTRVRAFLLASRSRRVAPPAPTHYDPRRGVAMVGQPWVSMAAALGWDGWVETEQTSETAAGRIPHLVETDRPAPTVIANADRWERHPAGRPARTVCGNRAPRWAYGPGNSYATGVTLVSAHRAKRQDRTRAGGERQHADSVKVTITEAAILQGMPADYPWHGSRTSQYQQIGNLVPPQLAEACIRQLIAEVSADVR